MSMMTPEGLYLVASSQLRQNGPQRPSASRKIINHLHSFTPELSLMPQIEPLSLKADSIIYPANKLLHNAPPAHNVPQYSTNLTICFHPKHLEKKLYSIMGTLQNANRGRNVNKSNNMSRSGSVLKICCRVREGFQSGLG